MLVHKQTLGVLEYAPWDGGVRIEQGVRVPVLRPADLEELALNPEEWWKVDNRTALAWILRRCWPWFDPVMNERGELIDARPWPSWRVYGEPEPRPEPQAPGKRRQRIRRGRKRG